VTHDEAPGRPDARDIAPRLPRPRPPRPVGPLPARELRARAHQSCIVRVNGRTLPKPHPSRISLWAVTFACCPQCQVVLPGTPCHDNGQPLAYAHDRRIQEAKVTLA
jgi:hypothetical protein